VTEQFAATTADIGIQPGCPDQPPPPGELVDVALCRVPGYRQARGLECARGDPGRLAAAGRLPRHEHSAMQHGRHHVLYGVHPPAPASCRARVSVPADRPCLRARRQLRTGNALMPPPHSPQTSRQPAPG